MTMDLKVSFYDEHFSKKLCETFRKYGVAIISDVFDPEECDWKMNEIINCFENLGTGIKRDDIRGTWTTAKLPPQTRPGLFQCLVGHIQPVWDIRGDPRVRMIFEVLYSDLRKKEVNDFYTSFDGINIVPNEMANEKKQKDWPHLDQTVRHEPWMCVQGQAVLTQTTACFRATPGSHVLYNEILDEEGVEEDDKTNWCLIKKQAKVKRICEEHGLQWQVPILSDKGSFIVWSSSTVHSARNSSVIEDNNTDFWRGWRGVIYVCYRPKDEVSRRAVRAREGYLVGNRLTNHWSEKVFPKKPGCQYIYAKPRENIIEEYIRNPQEIYKVIGHPTIDNNIA